MSDYCLAPEQAFPAAVEETYGIIAYAFDHAEELGIDPQKIVLAGHSAGGNLVAAALIKDAEAHHLKPCCALLEYFPVDNTVDPVNRLSPELQTNEFWVKRAQTEKLYTDFLCLAMPILPIRCVRRSRQMRLHLLHFLSVLSFPQARIVCETIQKLLSLRLVKAGVCVTAQRIPEAMHGFTTNRTPGWERALKKHIQFFREHLQEDNS